MYELFGISMEKFYFIIQIEMLISVTFGMLSIRASSIPLNKEMNIKRVKIDRHRKKNEKDRKKVLKSNPFLWGEH